MSAYGTLDPIDTRYLERLAASLSLENSKGERVALPVVSTNFEQAASGSSRFIDPGEIIVDASAASRVGWNVMRLQFPTDAAYDQLSRSGEVALPFRFDRAPAIRRIVFGEESKFEIWFTEFVDSDTPNDAFHFSSDGVALTCSCSWEAYDPGLRKKLFVSCKDALPAVMDIELVDGVLSAEGVQVRAVDGQKFAEKIELSSLHVDASGRRVWIPPAP